MRGPALVVLLVAAGLMGLWSLVASGQVIDSSACEKSCYEQKAVCVSTCGTRTNPVECEAQCHDELLDCLERCR